MTSLTDDEEWGAEQLALSPSDLAPGETNQWLQIIPPTPRSHTLPVCSHSTTPQLSQPTPERPPIHHANTWSFGQPSHQHPFFSTYSGSASSTPPLPASLPGQNYVQSSLGFAPSVLHPSLGRHRSVSSVGSIESFQSGLSGNTRWSTVTGSDCPSDGPEASLGSDGTPGLGGSGELALPQLTTLSIDPSLFRPKGKANKSKAKPKKGAANDEPVAEGEDENDAEDSDSDEDNLETARPRLSNPDLPDPEKFRKEARNDVPKKKNSHARKQTADHIPRPRNAFILFRKHVVDAKLIPASVEMRHQNVSIITAKMWSEAPPEQKAHFNELARIEKEEHMKKYPGYRYQPVYRRTNVIRRRVRKDEAEEEKCKSVAELLLKGKTGDALEEEIKDRIMTEEAPVPAAPKPKVNSRRGSAVELSKGALRALRAQARTQHTRSSSADWSDVSRAPSVDPDLMPTPPMLALNPRGSFAHGRRHSTLSMTGTPETIPSVELGGMVGDHSWREDMDSYSFPLGQDAHAQYFYPQPQVAEPASFDPSLSLLNNPTSVNGADRFGPNGLSLRYDIPSDVVFGSWADGPSPTSGAYPGRPHSERWDNGTGVFGQNILGIDMGLTAGASASANLGSQGNGGGGTHLVNAFNMRRNAVSASPQVLMKPPLQAGSNAQHGYAPMIGQGSMGGALGAALPPGSEMIPLDGLPFDENGLIDFEAALAQADEVAGW